MPIVTRKEDVAFELHGVRVADPYRWLEQGESEEVAEWTRAQNAETERVLAEKTARDALRPRIAELLRIGFVGAPAVRGRRYFHERRLGMQDQPILYVREGVGGEDRALLDPAPLSRDATTAVDWWYPSWDGALVAWGRSESGSEESTLHVRDVATGEDLADRIPHTQHASVAWLPDGKSFFYSRHPAPGTVPAGDEKYHGRIYHHVLGRDFSEDRRVFPPPGEERDKLDVPSVDISPNGRWLVVRVHMGWQKSEIYLRDLSLGDDAPVVPVAVGDDALFEPIPMNDRLYVMTNHGAPRYRLFEVDYATAGDRARWKEILGEREDVLQDVAILEREIVAAFMHLGATRIERFTREGESRGAIDLPQVGTAGIAAARGGDELFVSFTSYVTPVKVLRHDLSENGKPARVASEGVLPCDSARELTVWDETRLPASGVDLSDVEVSLLFATSKDGTRVPMFVVKKHGLPCDGSAPCVLWGYGGFNICQSPAFSVRTLLAVERGFVWATALLRGGGELGEDWHRAGMLEKKQNVFDDFIACAEELVAQKIASPSRLGIIGGSNGGLLVAAVATQRPELFRAALCLVPLTDMLRYHRFRIGKLWIPEYGDPDDEAAFEFLRAYSPYHRVVDGTSYPSMLIATADSDSRVDPMHARKLAARLQATQSGRSDASRPILLRVEQKAGHGAGKPVAKLVDELADELAFMFHELTR